MSDPEKPTAKGAPAKSDRAALDKFLSTEDQAAIVDAIRLAEKTSSGQIKVHIEPRCPVKDAYTRAVAVFAHLGLQQTRQRNAVLIYIASEHRRFAFVGDTGIHAEVGDPFWNEASQALSRHFRDGRVREGLVSAIAALGARLAAAFPPTGDEQNELSDEISTQGPPEAS